MTEVLHVNGSTTQERHAVTAAVDALLQACGAAITDYHQFSNVSMAVAFELAAGKLRDLAQMLRQCGVSLTQTSVEDLERLSAADPVLPVSGAVQITFFHHEPDPRVQGGRAAHIPGY